MRKIKRIIPAILCIAFILPVTSACQEAAVYIEMPDRINGGVENDPVILYQEDIPVEAFDPNLYFFPDELLPQDVTFAGFDQKTLNISYLDSNGDLLGLAYVRQYQSPPSDLFITQTIIQSPVPINSNMLKSGHFGDQYERVQGEYLVGSEAVMLETGSTIFNEQHTISYRFYKGNALVIIDLAGWNPFVNIDTVTALANTIYQRLPDEIPQPGAICAPSLEVRDKLLQQYFNTLELVDCEGMQSVTDTFVNGDSGICFHADILNVIKDLKVGIYSNHYSRLLYVKDFLYSPALGDWTTTLMDTIWGYGWQHLPKGEYQALFWVDGQLVSAVPFDFIP
ncbi:MAG: hypothetical protein GYA52_07530 [Chloroflexi bacterium]|jgi:hypothetical protein|nr:hypothetical protein [Chloroflexota bacterium]